MLLCSTTPPYPYPFTATTTAMESPSPSTEYPPAKRRKMSETNGHLVDHNLQQQPNPAAVATGSNTNNNGVALPNVPKRGARACTACRKGKNRCEGEVSNQ